MSIPSFPHINLKIDSKVLLVTFDRPKLKNAMNQEVYVGFAGAINWAAKSDLVNVVVLTGNGDFYSSGNDLSFFARGETPDPVASVTNLVNLMDALILFPKPIIAALNGPAIGIAFTTLGLLDFVYVSPKSYLYAPFVVSGQAPEGCSSYTFPQLFGVRFANEILYHGVKVTPEKAVSSGFASGLFQQNELVPKVMEIAKGLAANPMGSILQTKKVLRTPEMIETLKRVNRIEMAGVQERMLSPDFLEIMGKYMSGSLRSQKSKL